MIAERKPTSGRTPVGLFIPWRWENAFLGTASSPAAQSSMPGRAGILKGRVRYCFRCSTFQTSSGGLFVFIPTSFYWVWGDHSHGHPRRGVAERAAANAVARGHSLGEIFWNPKRRFCFARPSPEIPARRLQEKK